MLSSSGRCELDGFLPVTDVMLPADFHDGNDFRDGNDFSPETIFSPTAMFWFFYCIDCVDDDGGYAREGIC